MPSRRKSRSRRRHAKVTMSSIRKISKSIEKKLDKSLTRSKPIQKALISAMKKSGVGRKTGVPLVGKVMKKWNKALKSPMLKKFFEKNLNKEAAKHFKVSH